jgi:hypothetical protein
MMTFSLQYWSQEDSRGPVMLLRNFALPSFLSMGMGRQNAEKATLTQRVGRFSFVTGQRAEMAR